MTQNHRTPGKHIIDVFVSVHIIDISAFSLIDKQRLHAYRLKGADRAIDSAGNELLCPAEVFFLLFKNSFSHINISLRIFCIRKKKIKSCNLYILSFLKYP